MRKYLCVEEFMVDCYDDDGFSENCTTHVYAGTIYEREEDSKRIIGGRIALQGAENWLEIKESTLAAHFMEITPDVCIYECYCEECGETIRLPRPLDFCYKCNSTNVHNTMFDTCSCGTTVYFDEDSIVSGCENCGKRRIAPPKACPICGRSVVILGGNEEWRPTSFDPDSGGEPYHIECKCGLSFTPMECDYRRFVELWNFGRNED